MGTSNIKQAIKNLKSFDQNITKSLLLSRTNESKNSSYDDVVVINEFYYNKLRKWRELVDERTRFK